MNMLKSIGSTITILIMVISALTGCLNLSNAEEVKLGISLHYDDITDEAVDEHIEELNIDLLRFDIHWKDVEANNNIFEFKDYDPIINKYGSDRFIIILITPPNWAKTLYETDKEQYWVEWQEYVKEVALRYDFYYYQVDNEMNHILGTIAGRWLYDYDDRPIIIEKTGETLNNYDPTHKIIVNVMANSPNWYENLNHWLEESGKHIDVIGIDHYSETWTARANKWRPLTIVMEETIRSGSNYFGKDIGICEVGYSTYREGTHGEVQQERWINIELKELRDIVQTYNSQSYQSKFKFVIWYELFEGGSEFDYNPEAHFGIITKDGEPKMGYDDLKAQIAGFR